MATVEIRNLVKKFSDEVTAGKNINILTADGEFRDGVLYHAGMILYREEKE